MGLQLQLSTVGRATLSECPLHSTRYLERPTHNRPPFAVGALEHWCLVNWLLYSAASRFLPAGLLSRSSFKNCPV